MTDNVPKDAGFVPVDEAHTVMGNVHLGRAELAAAMRHQHDAYPTAKSADLAGRTPTTANAHANADGTLTRLTDSEQNALWQKCWNEAGDRA
jgi:hypothetical protein